VDRRRARLCGDVALAAFVHFFPIENRETKASEQSGASELAPVNVKADCGSIAIGWQRTGVTITDGAPTNAECVQTELKARP
jgi:hypothetical protein